MVFEVFDNSFGIFVSFFNVDSMIIGCKKNYRVKYFKKVIGRLMNGIKNSEIGCGNVFEELYYFIRSLRVKVGGGFI